MKKVIKISTLSIGILLIAFILAVIIYVVFVLLSYYRIGDTEIPVSSQSKLTIDENETLTALSYNIGYGVYCPEYTFFIGGGEHARGLNKDSVDACIDGVADVLTTVKPDFMFLQEVDTNSTRSFGINQLKTLCDVFPDYDNSYAENFHAPYLMYPLNEPTGSVHSGISILSKYQVQTVAERLELPSQEGLFDKMFDLDRCMLVNRTELSDGKQLVLINIHMTAFDEGGVVRGAQLKRMEALLKEESQKGNYVVMAGDFNHDLITTFGGSLSDTFAYDESLPDDDWVQVLPEDFKQSLLDMNYTMYFSTNEPTCRSGARPYKEGASAVWSIDGFIVSDNLQVKSVKTLTSDDVPGFTNFAYSDHNPVILEFSIK